MKTGSGGRSGRHGPIVELCQSTGGKGERSVKANINASRIGDAASRFAATLGAAGVPSERLARVMPHLVFEPRPMSPGSVQVWSERLLAVADTAGAMALFAGGAAVAVEVVPT